jgi:excisionase family DNA binding protein
MSTAERLPDIMTPEQAANYLQVNRETIYRYIRQGKLLAARLGRRYRIPRGSVEVLLRTSQTSRMSLPAPGGSTPTDEMYPLTLIRQLATDMGVDDLADRHDAYAHGRIDDADIDVADSELNGG